MNPYDPEDLGQVVSFVWINAAGTTTKVLWSRASGEATPRITNAAYPLAATTQISEIARSATAAGGWLVVSETTYPYKPALGFVFKDPVSLSHTSYFLPRFGECLKVTTAGVESECS
jgi:hypothetical protein